MLCQMQKKKHKTIQKCYYKCKLTIHSKYTNLVFIQKEKVKYKT